MRHSIVLMLLVAPSIGASAHATQSDELKIVEEVLRKAEEAGTERYKSKDLPGCIKSLRSGLTAALPHLQARPELKFVIEVEIEPATEGERAALKLFDICKIVRHSLNDSKPLRKGLASPAKDGDLTKASDDVDALRENPGNPEDLTNAYAKLIAKGVQVSGAGDRFVAIDLNNLAWHLTRQGEYLKARPLFERGVEIAEPTSYKRFPEMLDHLGWAAFRMTEFEKAERVFQRVVAEARKRKAQAKNENERADEDLKIAGGLHGLAHSYQFWGKMDLAQKHYDECLQIYKGAKNSDKALGQWVRCLNHYAGFLLDIDDPKSAQEMANLSRKLCPESDVLAIAQCKEMQAALYRARGEFGEAEKEFLGVVKSLDKNFPYELTRAQTGLAQLYMFTDRHAEAEELYKKIRLARIVKLGENHPEVAETLSNTSFVFRARKQFGEAEKLLGQSLEIRKNKVGEKHHIIAITYMNLAAVYAVTKREPLAEQYYLKALEIQKAGLGAGNREVALTLDNLGMLYLQMGRFADAEKRLHEGLAIRQNKLPAVHTDLALSHHNLGLLYAAQGRIKEAALAFDKDRRIRRQYVAQVLPILSFNQQYRHLLHQEENDIHSVISLGYAAKDDDEAVMRTASWLLNGKAMIHQVAAETILARSSKDPAVKKIFSELETTRQGLARLTIAADPKEYARLGNLEQDLVKKLQQAGKRLANAEPWVEFSEFCKHIPDNAAYVDILRLTPYDFKKVGSERRSEPRYVALVAFSTGKVKLIDLGKADEIDALVTIAPKKLFETDALRTKKGPRPAEQAMRAVLEPIAERVLHPLLPHIAGKKRWILSPDSNLWMVPWNALPLPKGDPTKLTYAVEEHTISYVISGRDLLPQRPFDVKTSAPAIFADPDYDLDAKIVAKQGGNVPELNIPGINFRSGVLGALLKERVKRLPFTAEEAKEIAPSLKIYAGAEPRIFLGAKAVKHAIRNLENPKVLVFSTHGFFLPGDEKNPDDDAHLRFGLLFAGCNDKKAPLEGVFSAMDLLSQDLRGCELVVLSACETGLGKNLDLNGVMGLRQCFQLAGADAVVASLWSVEDSSTQELMTYFFKGLADKLDRAEALAQAQRTMIAEYRSDSGAAHPLYWAAFTVTGRGK